MYIPKVSIIIPVYNGSNYLSEAIDSALAQSYKNIEILVVNDGSDDDGATEKVALSYGDKIRYLKKDNGGSSSALNYGIKKMNGDFFSWLSHDDLYAENKIKRQIELIGSNKNTISICGAGLIDGDGKAIPYPKKMLDGEFSSAQMMQWLCSGHNINGCGVLIPKSIIDNAGFFNEKFVYVNDLDYWFRLMMYGVDCICTQEKLVLTRIHPNQVTVKKSNLFLMEHKAMSEQIINRLLTGCRKDDTRKILQEYLRLSARLGEMDVVTNTIFELKSKGYNTKIVSYWIIFAYGKCINVGKKIYKKIFFKR